MRILDQLRNLDRPDEREILVAAPADHEFEAGDVVEVTEARSSDLPRRRDIVEPRSAGSGHRVIPTGGYRRLIRRN
jgi:hypothetical protein